MNRMLLVAQYEFLTNIKKKSFLMAAIGGPLFTIGIMVIAIVLTVSSVEAGQVKDGDVGYVDEAGIIANPPIDLPEGYRAFAHEEDARQALDNKDITVLAVIDASYVQTGKVSLTAYGDVPEDTEDELETFLSSNLAHSLSDDIPEERIKDPVNIAYFMENNSRALDSEIALVGVIMTPIVFIIIFMIALQLTGTYLMTSIVEEKTNRVMEILSTSVTPMQLLGGKLIGAGGLGLVQLAIWLVVGIIGLRLGQGSDLISAIRIPADFLLIALAYFVLNYFLVGSILAGIGVIVGSEQESRQLASVVTIFSVIPLILMITFLQDPDGPLPVILSIFPFTAPMAMMMRLLLSAVSPFEVALSFGLMIATTILVVWLSARVFRWGMLMYGKRITPRVLWQVIRGRADSISTPTLQGQ
jgi:ABC-2 type transport system permease protein